MKETTRRESLAGFFNQIGILYSAPAPEPGRASDARSTARIAQPDGHETIGPCSRSPMGEAIGYALNQWEAVSRFLDFGEVEIDEISSRTATRPTAIGSSPGENLSPSLVTLPRQLRFNRAV